MKGVFPVCFLSAGPSIPKLRITISFVSTRLDVLPVPTWHRCCQQLGSMVTLVGSVTSETSGACLLRSPHTATALSLPGLLELRFRT